MPILLAQNTVNYTASQPDAFNNGSVAITSNIYTPINLMISVGLGFLFLCVLLFAGVGWGKIGGFLGNPGPATRADGHKDLWRVLVGALAGLLLVGVVTYILPQFGKINLANSSSGTQTQPGTGTTGGGNINVPTGAREALFAAVLAGDDAVYKRLTGAGVQVKTNYPCTKLDQSDCTSLGGMREDTQQMLIRLKSTCSCEVVVTGGTEFWSHGAPGDNTGASTQHKPGGRAVDIRTTTSLSNYIQTVFAPSGDTRCGKTYVWSSFTFCLEKPGTFDKTTDGHWHVQ